MVVIARAPFRISFFGGGSDYPSHFTEYGGAVLGTTIDKYCWVTVCPPSPFGPKFKVVYSRVEETDILEEIEHPAVRECLRLSGFDGKGCCVYHHGDLPARSGVGSSSAFVVALLHALSIYSGKGDPFASTLANDAIKIEQEILKETVGCQDQWLIANGGLNKIDFRRDGRIACRRLDFPLPRANSYRLEAHLLLYYTGIQRTASDVAAGYIPSFGSKANTLNKLARMAEEGRRTIYDGALGTFGSLLDEAWQLKRSLGGGITNPALDALYERARAAGALGGKILGAGGGGFLLLFALPDVQPAVREAMGDLKEVPVRFEYNGSQIVCEVSR